MEAAIVNIETAVVCSCLSSASAYEGLLSKGLKPSMLSGENRKVFEKIVQYRATHKVDDISVLALDLPVFVAKKYLEASVDIIPYQWEQYYEALEKHYIISECKRIFGGIKDRQSCLQASIELVSLATSGLTEEQSLEEIVEKTKKVIEERQQPDYKNKYRFDGRLARLNELGQYEFGSLVTIGGGSGHGKTTFVLNMCINWLKNGLKVLYFSNEMSDVILLSKLLCIQERIKWNELFSTTGNKLSNETFVCAMEGLESLKARDLDIFVKPKTLPEINLIIKAYKPDVFILDTINALIDKETEETRTDISLGTMARSMKALAEELSSLAIVVGQLRDVSGRPTSKDLIKESRQIRDASDYMDFVYREFEQRPHSNWDILKDVFEVYRVKNRFGIVSECFLKFERETGCLSGFSQKEYDELVKFFKENRRKLYKTEEI